MCESSPPTTVCHLFGDICSILSARDRRASFCGAGTPGSGVLRRQAHYDPVSSGGQIGTFVETSSITGAFPCFRCAKDITPGFTLEACALVPEAGIGATETGIGLIS